MHRDFDQNGAGEGILHSFAISPHSLVLQPTLELLRVFFKVENPSDIWSFQILNFNGKHGMKILIFFNIFLFFPTLCVLTGCNNNDKTMAVKMLLSVLY